MVKFKTISKGRSQTNKQKKNNAVTESELHWNHTAVYDFYLIILGAQKQQWIHCICLWDTQCVLLVQVSGLFEGAGSAVVRWYAQSWNTPERKLLHCNIQI